MKTGRVNDHCLKVCLFNLLRGGQNFSVGRVSDEVCCQRHDLLARRVVVVLISARFSVEDVCFACVGLKYKNDHGDTLTPLPQCFRCTSPNLQAIAPSMGRLSSLTLDQCPITPSTVKFVLEKCPELTNLVVSTQHGLVDKLRVSPYTDPIVMDGSRLVVEGNNFFTHVSSSK